jgi:hypothetical protein
MNTNAVEKSIRPSSPSVGLAYGFHAVAFLRNLHSAEQSLTIAPTEHLARFPPTATDPDTRYQ